MVGMVRVDSRWNVDNCLIFDIFLSEFDNYRKSVNYYLKELLKTNTLYKTFKKAKVNKSSKNLFENYHQFKSYKFLFSFIVQ